MSLPASGLTLAVAEYAGEVPDRARRTANPTLSLCDPAKPSCERYCGRAGGPPASLSSERYEGPLVDEWRMCKQNRTGHDGHNLGYMRGYMERLCDASGKLLGFTPAS
eukprot:COSAG02_NODE_9971_length_2061_cov_1.319062_2_plen_108_part_00